MNCPRQQFLDSVIPNRDSSKIRSLYKKAILFIAQNISKVPKGGGSINISADKILGQHPIISHEETIPILTFLSSKGIHFLEQISSWDPLYHLWLGWSFPDVSTILIPSLVSLQSFLHSKAPIKKNERDGLRWDPTVSYFSVRVAHQKNFLSTFPMPIWKFWRMVWKSEALPKIKFSSGPY